MDFLPSELCALIGGNNTGKSNILKALNLVLGDSWPSTRSISEEDFFGYDTSEDMVISVWFDEKQTVTGDVGDQQDFSGIQFRVTKYQRKSGKHVKGDPKSEFVCIDDSGNPVTVLRRNPRAAASSKPHPQVAGVTQDIRDNLPTVMVDVDRNAKYHLSGNRYTIFGRLLLDVSKKLKQDAERYKEFEEKFEEARKVLRTDDFNVLTQKITEQVQSHTGMTGIDIALDGIDPINLYKSFSILFKDSFTPQSVDVERMGSGIQSAVVISLLQAYRELRKESAVLLFEEPELFLHPHGRRHLYRLLCDLSENGTQVIYTTHSQDFVDLAKIESVQLVSRNVDEGTIVQGTSTQNVSSKQKQRRRLVREFSAPRNEIFFANSVILVEGPTEQATIRFLAPMMSPSLDLDFLNCSVIEVGGKDQLPLYIKMVHALGKKLLVIYDSDSHHVEAKDIATDNKRKEEIDSALGDRDEVFVCDPYLEEMAGVEGHTKRDKERQMRDFLESIGAWDELSLNVQSLMDKIAIFVRDSS